MNDFPTPPKTNFSCKLNRTLLASKKHIYAHEKSPNWKGKSSSIHLHFWFPSFREVSIIYQSWSDFRGCSGLQNLPTVPQHILIVPHKKSVELPFGIDQLEDKVIQLEHSLQITSSRVIHFLMCYTFLHQIDWTCATNMPTSIDPRVKPRDKRLTPRYFGAKCCCCRLRVVQMPSLNLSKLANPKAKMLNWSAGDDFLRNEGFDSVSCKDHVSIFNKFSWIQ